MIFFFNSFDCDVTLTIMVAIMVKNCSCDGDVDVYIRVERIVNFKAHSWLLIPK